MQAPRGNARETGRRRRPASDVGDGAATEADGTAATACTTSCLGSATKVVGAAQHVPVRISTAKRELRTRDDRAVGFGHARRYAFGRVASAHRELQVAVCGKVMFSYARARMLDAAREVRSGVGWRGGASAAATG